MSAERDQIAAAIRDAMYEERQLDGATIWEKAERYADAILAARPATEPLRLPYVDTTSTDRHGSAVHVAAILDALTARKARLRGLWVQYHGDGTERAAKGEVVVSVQFDHFNSGYAMAEQGIGPTVAEASSALIAALAEPGQPR